MKKHSLHSSFYPHIDADKFTKVVKKLRSFFDSKGFLEVHTQNRLSILAACEDPFNIRTFDYDNKIWPLPQTGQMWLEHELLTQPDAKGFYCVSTSYRKEEKPIEGRHCLIFPMFEFEFPGDVTDLAVVEAELLTYLGFTDPLVFKNYNQISKDYGVSVIDSQLESKLAQDLSNTIFLSNFPERTSPFWNMARWDDDSEYYGTAKKIDVILHGQETIGSAERSCDPELMKDIFFTIENGKYAEKLFDLFGFTRVMDELEEFLANDFIPRVGGGIGMTRLIRAMELSNLI